MIDQKKIKKDKLKSFILDPRWILVEEFAEEMKNFWDKENLIGETEYDTSKKVLLKEGRKEGIIRFFQEIKKRAFKEKEND